MVVGENGALDPYAVWHDAREIEEAGALLIRSNGYVAWRVQTLVWGTEKATRLLRDAGARVTCQDSLRR